MESKGILVEYLAQLKENATILARLKNAKAKKILEGKKEKSIVEKSEFVVKESKKYAVNILDEKNKKNENVVKIFKTHMDEYKEVAENVSKTYLACHQDANIEVLNLEVQRIENMREIKVYNDFKKDLVEKTISTNSLKMNKYIETHNKIQEDKSILNIANKNNNLEVAKKVKEEISTLENQKLELLGENAAVYKEVDRRLEETKNENVRLKESIDNMSEKMKEIENADLDLDKQEDILESQKEENIEENNINIKEEKEKNEKKEKKEKGFVEKTAINLGKVVAINYVVGMAMGPKVLEGYLLKKVCRTLTGCKYDLPTKIACSYITDKDKFIEKSKQYIKASGAFIESVREHKEAVSFVENISRSTMFGTNIAKDIVTKGKEKIQEIAKEKIQEIGEAR